MSVRLYASARPTRLAAGALLALALAACGETGPTAAAGVRADLRIEMGDRSWTLKCQPAAGSWAAAKAACGRFDTAGGRAALAPITAEPRDLVPITKVPLRVSGTLAGDRVDIAIPEQGSSLRLKRYGAIRTLLGTGAFDAARRSAG